MASSISGRTIIMTIINDLDRRLASLEKYVRGPDIVLSEPSS